MSDCQHVQHCIRRTTHRHDYRDGIFKSLAGQNLAGQQLVMYCLTEQMPIFLHCPLFCILSCHCGGIEQTHPHRFKAEDMVLAVYIPPQEPAPGKRGVLLNSSLVNFTGAIFPYSFKS